MKVPLSLMKKKYTGLYRHLKSHTVRTLYLAVYGRNYRYEKVYSYNLSKNLFPFIEKEK